MSVAVPDVRPRVLVAFTARSASPDASMKRMDIRVLGPLTVRADGRELALGGVKQRALLSMLALRMNGAIDVTALIDGLWDADLPEHPRRTIQVYVSRLRRALPAPADPGPDVSVVRRSDGYALVGDPDTCDLNWFQRLTAKGYAAWPDDPDRARSALHQALSLWRGEPLREFVHEPFAQPKPFGCRRCARPRSTCGSKQTWPAADTGRLSASWRS